MEENVALDSSKQKQFVKSIKGIKKLIKKNDRDGVSDKIVKSKGKHGKVQKEKRKPRGLVYLGHIPHGFYENEMTQYFKQFGVVTNVRVIRSKRTGRSKGHAFVEFRDPDVAEIVAETMNNYLMGKRLIKAASIPPEKQRRFALRKHWNAVHNPTNEARIKMKKAYNANLDEDGEIKKARKILANFRKTKRKLNDLGVNYDIFSPVDVPEALLQLLEKPEVKQEKPDAKNVKVADLKKTLKKEQKQEQKIDKKDEKKSQKKDEKIDKKNEKKSQKKEETINKKDEKINQKKDNVKTVKAKSNKKEVNVTAAVKREHKVKEQKLKDAGVKSVENFIKLKQDSDADSDSDYEFDSDEFDKMLENEADSDTELEDAENEEESDNNDSVLEESEEEEVPAPKIKPPQKTSKVKGAQQAVKQLNSQKVKRQANEDPPNVTKKSKFENRNTQKLSKKQFKRK